VFSYKIIVIPAKPVVTEEGRDQYKRCVFMENLCEARVSRIES